MLNFYLENEEFEINFEGLTVIQTNNPNWFVKNLHTNLQQKEFIRTNNKTYKSFLHISELTKLNELINLNKTNLLTHFLLDSNLLKNVLNNEEIFNSLKEINQKLGIQYLNFNDDKYKFLNSIIECNEEIFINNNLLINCLDFIKKAEKQLLIINSIENLKIDNLLPYLNYFDFVIVTNDFRNYINNINKLELVNIYNKQNKQFFSLIDTNKFFSYLEFQLKSEITEKDINSYLNKENTKKNIEIRYFFDEIC